MKETRLNSMRQLVRLHQWELDEKRQRLAELESFKSRMLDDLGRLEGEMESEAAAAQGSSEGAIAYPGFVAAAIARREKLVGSIRNIEDSIAGARDEVTLAYQEVRRYELAVEKQLRRGREKERKRDQSLMDEMGTSGYRQRAGQST